MFKDSNDTVAREPYLSTLRGLRRGRPRPRDDPGTAAAEGPVVRRRRCELHIMEQLRVAAHLIESLTLKIECHKLKNCSK